MYMYKLVIKTYGYKLQNTSKVKVLYLALKKRAILSNFESLEGILI